MGDFKLKNMRGREDMEFACLVLRNFEKDWPERKGKEEAVVYTTKDYNEQYFVVYRTKTMTVAHRQERRPKRLEEGRV